METPQTLSLRAEELKERFVRACEMKQAVNWEIIVACFQQWAAVMRIEGTPVVQIEGSEQNLKASEMAGAADQASRAQDAGKPEASWAIRATREKKAAMESKIVTDLIRSAPALVAARGAVIKSAMWAASFGKIK